MDTTYHSSLRYDGSYPKPITNGILNFAHHYMWYRMCPSLTENINLKSSHYNNVKMTIAYNSTYVQTETLNFTFAQQAVIVYFDAEC